MRKTRSRKTHKRHGKRRTHRRGGMNGPGAVLGAPAPVPAPASASAPTALPGSLGAIVAGITNGLPGAPITRTNGQNQKPVPANLGNATNATAVTPNSKKKKNKAY